ncbi:VOC family protein [Crossiella sp. NPDC003009]
MAWEVQVAMDASDPSGLAGFWALALGYVRQPPPPGHDSWEAFAEVNGMTHLLGDRDALIDPAGLGPRLYFQRVPEEKAGKNRVHLDIRASKGAEDEAERARLVGEHVARLVAAGARVLWEVDEPSGRCTVLADPEGNEFCVA